MFEKIQFLSLLLAVHVYYITRSRQNINRPNSQWLCKTVRQLSNM